MYRTTITVLPLIPIAILLVQNSVKVTSQLGRQDVVLDRETKVESFVSWNNTFVTLELYPLLLPLTGYKSHKSCQICVKASRWTLRDGLLNIYPETAGHEPWGFVNAWKQFIQSEVWGYQRKCYQAFWQNWQLFEQPARMEGYRRTQTVGNTEVFWQTSSKIFSHHKYFTGFRAKFAFKSGQTIFETTIWMAKWTLMR